MGDMAEATTADPTAHLSTVELIHQLQDQERERYRRILEDEQKLFSPDDPDMPSDTPVLGQKTLALKIEGTLRVASVTLRGSEVVVTVE
jgi:hypothetical protein